MKEIGIENFSLSDPIKFFEFCENLKTSYEAYYTFKKLDEHLYEIRISDTLYNNEKIYARYERVAGERSKMFYIPDKKDDFDHHIHLENENIFYLDKFLNLQKMLTQIINDNKKEDHKYKLYLKTNKKYYLTRKEK